MSANTLDTTTYDNVATNTVFDAVLDASVILAWRQNVKSVVDQHATEINGKVSLTGGELTGDLLISKSAPKYSLKDTATNKTFYIESASSEFRIAESGVSNRLIIDTSGIVTVSSGVIRLASTARIISSAGSPEGAITAPVGSIYLRTDGGTSTTLYVKQSGTGNTGWIAK